MIMINPYQFTAPAATSLRTGLISVYDFDEIVTGNAVDSHGSNDVTVWSVAPTINQPGLLDKAYKFNASYIQTSGNIAALESANQFTVSFWVKNIVSTANSLGTFCFNPNTSTYKILAGYFSGSSTNDAINFYVRTASGASACSVAFPNASVFKADNVWHMCTSVYNKDAADGLRLKLYWDGALIASAAGYNQPVAVGSGKWAIGYWGSTSIRLNATLDQLAIWSKALTPDEIAALYNGGAGLAYNLW